MIELLRFAAVPIPPIEQVRALLGPETPGPVLLALPDVEAAGHDANPIAVDQHVLSGNLARGHQLSKGRQLLVLDQIVRSQMGAETDATALLAYRGPPLDEAIARVFAAWADPKHVGVLPEALKQAREAGGAAVVARLGLVAALALQAAGDEDGALIETLRSLSYGRERSDRRMEAHATRLLGVLQGARQDVHVAQLVQVTRALGSRDGSVLFDRIAQATLDLVEGAGRAFVLLGGPESLQVVGRALRPGESGSPSLAIAANVVLQGREVITQDVGAVAVSESIESMNLRTALCVPLFDERRCIGVVYADSRGATDQDLQQVAWLVRAFAAYAAVAVKNRELLDAAERRTLHAREVAHDLSNVASGLRLGIDELGELHTDPETRITLRDLRQMSSSIMEALQGLLDDRTPTRTPLDLAALVQEGVTLLRFQARARQVRLRVGTEPALVHGSAVELGRVIANLVGNAIKYSEPGSDVLIRVGTRDHRAFVIVADEGPGIPPDALASIFASGTQAEGARPGHGLGLAICRTIVEDHGGTLGAANRKTRGARFTAVLPRLRDGLPDD